MLKWVFGADTGPFRSSLNALRKETGEFTGSVKGQIAGLFAGGALIAGAQNIISHFARIQDIADKFGESAESIQKVGFAASQSGTDIETMNKALTTATKNAVAATSSGGEMADVFKRLGISAESFANLPMEEKIAKLSEGYNNATSKAAGLSDIMKALGKGGGEAIPLLTQDVEDLIDQMNSAPVASDGVVKALAGIDDKIDEFKTQAMSIGGVLVAGFAALAASASAYFMGFVGMASSGFSFLDRMIMGVGHTIQNALSGNFEGAEKSARDMVSGAETALADMAGEAIKAKKTVDGIWKDVFDGTSEKKVKGPDIEQVKLLEDRLKLTEEIAKLEEDAAMNRLNIAEKILALEKKRAEMGAESIFNGDEDSRNEARKKELELANEIQGLREKKGSEDDSKAKEIQGLKDQGIELDRENKLSGMSDKEKLVFFKSEREQTKVDAKNASDAGDEKKALEFENKGKKLTGQILDLEKKKEVIPSIMSSALTDIGGGGTAKIINNDPQRKMIDILQVIANNTAGGDDGARPPEPI